jgi:hypothetical protein
MFLYSLSSRLDRIDPYWYARLIGLKAAYLATGLFIANLILKPASPSVTMLMSAVGILIAEMPAINTPDKKDKVYLGWVILVCLTIAIFSTTGFLKLPFILTVGAWAYFLYYSLRNKPEVFALVSALLMMGTISQEGLKIGNFFQIWNNTLFILEFSLITFWLHKSFPFLYHKIWLSSLLRGLEVLIKMLKEENVTTSKMLRKHSMISLSSMNLLAKRRYIGCVKIIHQNMSGLHLYVYHQIHSIRSGTDNLELQIDGLEQLYNAILHGKRCETKPDLNKSTGDGFYQEKLAELIINWNRLCLHLKN